MTHVGVSSGKITNYVIIYESFFQSETTLPTLHFAMGCVSCFRFH